MPALDHLHLVVGGFLQGRRDSGSVRLFRLLRDVVSSPQQFVDYQPWNTDWPEYTSFLRCLADDLAGCQVSIYAFSWGAGSVLRRSWYRPGLLQLLQRSGVVVRDLVLSDPVHCAPLWIQRWRAALPGACQPVLRVPANVQRVRGVYQRMDWPQGSRLHCDCEETQVVSWERINLPHVEMDDSPRYHQMAWDAAQG